MRPRRSRGCGGEPGAAEPRSWWCWARSSRCWPSWKARRAPAPGPSVVPDSAKRPRRSARRRAPRVRPRSGCGRCAGSERRWGRRVGPPPPSLHLPDQAVARGQRASAVSAGPGQGHGARGADEGSQAGDAGEQHHARPGGAGRQTAVTGVHPARDRGGGGRGRGRGRGLRGGFHADREGLWTATPSVSASSEPMA